MADSQPVTHTFQRAGNRRPFLAPGLAGRFDSKMIWALPNPIPGYTTEETPGLTGNATSMPVTWGEKTRRRSVDDLVSGRND